jgi:hypothetical protein
MFLDQSHTAEYDTSAASFGISPSSYEFARGMARTPSPTPSEQRALADDGRPSIKKLLQRENRGEYSNR